MTSYIKTLKDLIIKTLANLFLTVNQSIKLINKLKQVKKSSSGRINLNN